MKIESKQIPFGEPNGASSLLLSWRYCTTSTSTIRQDKVIIVNFYFYIFFMLHDFHLGRLFYLHFIPIWISFFLPMCEYRYLACRNCLAGSDMGTLLDDYIPRLLIINTCVPSIDVCLICFSFTFSPWCPPAFTVNGPDNILSPPPPQHHPLAQQPCHNPPLNTTVGCLIRHPRHCLPR